MRLPAPLWSILFWVSVRSYGSQSDVRQMGIGALYHSTGVSGVSVEWGIPLPYLLGGLKVLIFCSWHETHAQDKGKKNVNTEPVALLRISTYLNSSGLYFFTFIYIYYDDFCERQRVLRFLLRHVTCQMDRVPSDYWGDSETTYSQKSRRTVSFLKFIEFFVGEG